LNRDWIKWDTAIKEVELPLFYSSIDAFAYLSEYEGFGLPPLEALACGTVPVLLNETSLREIYKDMAIMVDSLDVHKIKEALIAAIKDKGGKQAILSRFSENRIFFNRRELNTLNKDEKLSELSIIIVNSNDKPHLEECLSSIEENAQKMNYEILVVDNNSSDGSQEFIKQNYPQIKLIINEENLGDL